MPTQPEFDVQAAHQYFSAQCFNGVWDLLDKQDRTPQEDERMIRMSLASTWHWTQRENCTDTNLSVGYWQTSRVYAVLGQAGNARRYGQLCLEVSQGDDVSPFYLGYAYEALSRPESLAGNQAQAGAYLEKAREAAADVADEDTRQLLLDDLETIA